MRTATAPRRGHHPAAGPSPRRRPARSARPAGALLVPLLAIVGVSVLLYPVIAGWFSQLVQVTRVDDYDVEIRELDHAERQREIAEAHGYNATLTGGALIDPHGRTPLAQQRDIVATYLEQLNLGPADVMATLRVPSAAIELPVYHGTDDETLLRGVGHLLGSALPVGGEGTHAVLTGHRGLPESELFTNLDRVVVGDLVEVEVYGELLTYRVAEVRIVEPTDASALAPVAGRDLLSLITCTPLGINSHRIIVTAERIPNPSSDDPALTMPALPEAPWWAPVLGAVWGGAALYRTLLIRTAHERAARRDTVEI